MGKSNLFGESGSLQTHRRYVAAWPRAPPRAGRRVATGRVGFADANAHAADGAGTSLLYIITIAITKGVVWTKRWGALATTQAGVAADSTPSRTAFSAVRRELAAELAAWDRPANAPPVSAAEARLARLDLAESLDHQIKARGAVAQSAPGAPCRCVEYGAELAAERAQRAELAAELAAGEGRESSWAAELQAVCHRARGDL